MRIDLHIHSTASDGTLSPTEILALAKDLNLEAIAITDHDTIGGSKEAILNGIPPSLKFITGVEISASPPRSFSSNSGSLHILGYGIRLEDPLLNKTLKMLQESRSNRNPHIIDRLNRLGFDLSLKEVVKEIGGGQIGRPHIAQVMIKKKYVESIDEAFDKYLGKGKPAYVDKYRIKCAESIAIIRRAGGIPVLAHPILLDYKSNEVLENLVKDLMAMGLMGIEVYYSDHTPAHIAYYSELAKRFKLLMTGGTDFHGSIKPNVKMGSGKGDLFVPYELYETLIKTCNKLRS